jgi:hypothetical protein
MSLGRFGRIIGAFELPPLKPLTNPSADIFCAALRGRAPNLGKGIGISFNRFARLAPAPFEGDEKRHATKNFTISIGLNAARTRQIKNLQLRFGSIEPESALAWAASTSRCRDGAAHG